MGQHEPPGSIGCSTKANAPPVSALDTLNTTPRPPSKTERPSPALTTSVGATRPAAFRRRRRTIPWPASSIRRRNSQDPRGYGLSFYCLLASISHSRFSPPKSDSPFPLSLSPLIVSL